jgi:hypothetical protein
VFSSNPASSTRSFAEWRPEEDGEIAQRLADVFPDFTLESFEQGQLRSMTGLTEDSWMTAATPTRPSPPLDAASFQPLRARFRGELIYDCG